MDLFTGFDKAIKKQNKDLQKTINKQNKSLAKSMNLTLKKSISQEGRVRIPAKRRHEVENKYNKKCAVCKKKPSGVTLQIHHKNMKNNDNKLSNLELLCPNDHIARHSKAFRRVYKDSFGNKRLTRLVKKKPKKKKKCVRKKSHPLYGNFRF